MMTEAMRRLSVANNDTITIGKKEIQVVRRLVDQSLLRFYPENPRIYSLVVDETGELPSQKEIEETLIKYEHVKLLLQSIKANGGLIDPLVVRDGDYTVIEGNSRLAAYRLLASKDPIKWGMVKCCLIPSDIEDDLISSLLGEYHIIGRKDWAPYEQAGYLWRRYSKYHIPTAKIEQEIGLSEKTIKQYIEVYEFMIANDDNKPQRWSYYFEYLRSNKIRNMRRERSRLDKVVVKKIKSGEIPKAEDVRDKLTRICAMGGKTFNKFLNDRDSFEICYARAIDRGAENTLYNALHRFRMRLADSSDVKKDFRVMPENQKKKCIYEMKKIKSIVQVLLQTIKE
jgi:hypothetical protein